MTEKAVVLFKRIDSIEPVAKYIASVIKERLEKDHRILWLVPGGSSIQVAVRVSELLRETNLKNLTMTLTDERFGELNHPDSNWLQLKEAGFSLPAATLIPVIRGRNLFATVDEFAKILARQLSGVDFRLGFFGIGADGHTAGILPGSPAVQSRKLAVGYDAGQFKRVTITPTAISRLDEAVVYAISKSKRPVLNGLEEDIPFKKQPAQALKDVPRLTIFNDYKGEEI